MGQNSPDERHRSRDKDRYHKDLDRGRHRDKDVERSHAPSGGSSRDRERDRHDRHRDEHRKDRDHHRSSDRGREQQRRRSRSRSRSAGEDRSKRRRTRDEPRKEEPRREEPRKEDARREDSRKEAARQEEPRRGELRREPSPAAAAGGGGEREARVSGTGAAVAAAPAASGSGAGAGAVGAGAGGAEDAALRREREAAALDDEVERRRKRVEEWRRKKQAEAEAAAAAVAAAAVAAAADASAAALKAGGAGGVGADDGRKGWSLEDDDDDEDGGRAGAKGGDDDDEVDPLDAFMAENGEAQAKPASAEGGIPNGDAAGGGAPREAGGGIEAMDEDEEEDALDAFMAQEVLPEVDKLRQRDVQLLAAAAAEAATTADADAAATEAAAAAAAAATGDAPSAPVGPPAPSAAPAPASGATTVVPAGGRFLNLPGRAGAVPRPGGAAGGGGSRLRPPSRFHGSDDSGDEDEEESEESDDEEWARAVTAGKMSKGDKLGTANHAAITYPPFRRNFYIEVPEIARMSDAEVAALRKELDGIKVRGKDAPKPVRTWTQTGLSSRVLDVLRRGGYERPLPIQAQTLPIIMSGRDCIGIAKTGSGKTLAFVLPMLRHIKDQPPLEAGDGPIGVIMAPTRELVQQIAKEVKRFSKSAGLTAVPVFGGSGVANQISELKRGAEVVVCTPGRMIDLLVTAAGKITNLRRCTYLVIDEADRMFDMGFEPQIMRIVNNIRPDRQVVMFSATFPRAVETLARAVLMDPVEVQVGGRSIVNPDITQAVEIRPESDRFLRLLEILGEWYERGKLLIFVHTQEKCDNLFRDLLKSGYPCLSLHGGKDQADRECTIADFRGSVCNILVATSVAARGLDVRDLVLVVNYDVPNHHEDYVHRVGRTGRAGAKGTAITFIGPEEERYAPDLVKALTESSAPVPQDLQAMADSFNVKRKAGLVHSHASGFGGSGFKFNKEEEGKVKAARKAKAKEYGMGGDESAESGSDSGESDDDIRPAGAPAPTAAATSAMVTAAGAAAAAAAASATGIGSAPRMVPSLPNGAAASVAPKIAPAPAPLGAAAATSSALAASMPAIPGAAAPPPAPLGLTDTVAAAAAAAAAAAGIPTDMLAAAQAAAMRAAASLAAAHASSAMPSMGVPLTVPSMAAPLAGVTIVPVRQGLGAGAAAAAAAAGMAAGMAAPGPKGFQTELEINDFPQHARWRVGHKRFQSEVTELTGAAVTTKGIYVRPGDQPPEGERKLYLLIEGPTEQAVKKAKAEVKKALEESTEKAMRKESGAAGRYNI